MILMMLDCYMVENPNNPHEPVETSGLETITAASASFLDVSTAIARANPGDTVIVPAGSATWSQRLEITKGINLIGAGIGSTVITGSYNALRNDFDPLYFLVTYQPSDPAANDPFRLSGFTFNCGSKCGGLILKNATTKVIDKVRIDHTRWQGVSGVIFVVYGSIYGVADNNVWTDGRMMRFAGLNETTINAGFTLTNGGSDNFFLEDNTITCLNDDYFYVESNGRLCLRHNNIDCSSLAAGYWPVIHFHTEDPNANYGTLGGDVYENTFNFGSRGGRVAQLQNGKIVFWGNEILTTSAVDLEVSDQFDDGLNGISALADGTPLHPTSNYIWSNTKNRTTILGDTRFPFVGFTNTCSVSGEFVPTENVHFWKHISPFTGSYGVGVGALSARPSSGLKPGVGYWATDTNTLYRATTSTTWETYYTPYTYPHPLRKD
jgi:hypothetical protein